MDNQAPEARDEYQAPPAPAQHSFEQIPVHHTSFNRDEPHLHYVNGVPILSLPEGWNSQRLDQLATHQPYKTPPFITADVGVQDNRSFAQYFERFKGSELIAANRGNQVVETIFDYHDRDSPQMCAHKLRRIYKIDRVLNRWREVSKRNLTQKQFATFLQDRLGDVAREQQASLAASIRSFKLAVNMKYTREDNLANGDTKFTFIRESNQEGAVLPEIIRIVTPIFEFGRVYELNVRVSYTVDANQGTVVFSLEIIELDDFIDEAFREEVKLLSSDVKKEIIYVAS